MPRPTIPAAVALAALPSTLALAWCGPAAVASAAPAAASPAVPAADGLVEPDGSLWALDASYPAVPGLARPVIGWAPRPGGGAWEVAGDGGIFARGGAPFFGSTGGVHLAEPVVGMAPTPDGGGYWLVASDGGVFAFGDARFFGSTGGVHLAEPVVGMTPTPDGAGYWLVASDGGIFPFGSAGFDGSAAGREAAPAVSVTANASGYDVVGSDGSLWSFRPGAAPAQTRLPVPASELAPSRQTQEVTEAVDTALAQVGKPYVYGASGPNAYDCSGLAQYSYASAGIPLPRTAAAQFASTPHVADADLQPGDLMFFGAGLSHVGMYVGNGQMVDAPHPGATVRVESYQYFGPLDGVTRPTEGH